MADETRALERELQTALNTEDKQSELDAQRTAPQPGEISLEPQSLTRELTLELVG